MQPVKNMSERDKMKFKAIQKINELILDLKMMQNGLRVVDSKFNSNLWLCHIRTDTANLQTLINELYEKDN